MLLLLRHRATNEERLAIRRTAYALLVLALLTHLVYPVLYYGLLGVWGQPMVVVTTIVMALRNIALVAFTGYLGGLAWRLLSAGQPRRADA